MPKRSVEELVCDLAEAHCKIDELAGFYGRISNEIESVRETMTARILDLCCHGGCPVREYINAHLQDHDQQEIKGVSQRASE